MGTLFFHEGFSTNTVVVYKLCMYVGFPYLLCICVVCIVCVFPKNKKWSAKKKIKRWQNNKQQTLSVSLLLYKQLYLSFLLWKIIVCSHRWHRTLQSRMRRNIIAAQRKEKSQKRKNVPLRQGKTKNIFFENIIYFVWVGDKQKLVGSGNIVYM